MMKTVSIIFLCMLLISCVNTQAIKDASIDDAKKHEPINGATAGCDGQGLTRDCSIMNGATKVIAIKDKKMRVASNDSGTIVLTMHDEDECGMTEFECHNRVNNRNYELLKEHYINQGISIISVQAVAVGIFIGGYKLTLNQDGYSIITK